MADQEQETIGTEDELFAEVLGAPSPVTSSEPAPTGESIEGQPRDEHGRFAPKANDAADAAPATNAPPATEHPPPAADNPPAGEAAPPPAKEERDGWIPSWRAREINEAKRQEAERAARAEADAVAARGQAAQFQRQMAELNKQLEALKAPKQEPVNLFDDPDAFVGTVEQRLAQQADNFQKQLRTMRLEQNLAFANMVHKDVFPKAYEAFTAAVEGGDKAVAARVFNSADPGGMIVAWHREQEVIREVGSDPSAYRQKIIDDALKDPTIIAKVLELAKAQASGAPPPQGQPAANTRPNVKTQLPPSLRSMPGTSATSDGTGISNMSEAELFEAAIGR